jgi:DNA-binding transcriptional ArsR family regulator
MSAIDVIFPKVRAELVRLLFADPAKELHLRELSRLSSLAIGTVQQEVVKLSAAELLTSRRDGNRLYYRANTGHPIFPDLQGIALKTTGLRDQLASALAGLPGVDLAFVFGSQASGTAGAGSDVDLLVIGKVGLRIRPLTSTLGREINPHVLSRETLASKTEAGDAFIANVLAAPKLWIIGGADELGKLVYERMAPPLSNQSVPNRGPVRHR